MINDDDDMLDDDAGIDWEQAASQIDVMVVTNQEEVTNLLHQVKVVAPVYNFEFKPPSEDVAEAVAGYAIFIVEVRIMTVFDDLQKIRAIRQARPMVPIIAISKNDDPTFQSGIYEAGGTEVIAPSINPQILGLKLDSSSKLSEAGQVLEIKNQESIRAMKSLREANENLKKEMHSRIEAESQKAIAEKQAEQHKQIREIMDHLSEGYFWVTKDKKISEQTSASCAKIFGLDIANYVIGSENKLGFEDPNKEGHLSACLEQIFDDFMPESVTLSMIPSKCRLNNEKIITFDYTIIRDKEDAPEKIIVQAKDITEEEKERQKSEELQRESQKLINILRNKESFSNFVTDFRKLIEEIKSVGMEDTVVAKRILHTLKGNSALFGLTEVAHTIHDIETQAADLENDAITENIPKYCEAIEGKLVTFLETHNDILQIGYGEQVEKFVIDSNVLSSLYEISEELPAEQQQNLKETLDLIKMRPISFFTALFENTVKKVASLGAKKIHFQLSGLDLKVDVERLESLFQNLIHALRNSCDHGIETPDERLAAGKPEVGTVQMSFVRDEAVGMHIQIKDDGKGIDPSSVRRKAVAMKVKSEDEVAQLSDDEAIELIFCDGISTAQEVSDISGRGVGMSALKERVEELGGHIKTTTEVSKGTTFDIVIPDNKNEDSLAAKFERGFKIMICEDEEALAQIYSEILSRKGFLVNAFDNGMDALLELSKESYDLIITDLRMPGLGGETVVQKIRELSNGADAVPVIVISGYVSDETREELSSYSRVKILEKPVGIRKILPVIEETLGT